MKKIFFVTIWLFITNCSLIKAQDLNEMDSIRITYIYNYIINFHISAGCVTCLLDETSFDIKNSFLSLSKFEFSEFELNGFKNQLEIDSFGKKLNLKNRIDYSKLNSQFRIRLDTLDYEKTFKYFYATDEVNKEHDCRLYIKLSDIYYKNNRYYVMLNSNEKYASELFSSHYILFEFEICKSNGIIAFRSWTDMFGIAGDDHTKKGRLNFENKIVNIDCYND
jgi:hypothetical protein